ncbi:MAG: hypothetical protein ABJP70_12530 [Erythrobacter sp.]
MIVHPSIAKLRGDRAAQHRARSRMQAAVMQWRNSAIATALCGALKGYSSGADLKDCNALFQTMNEVSAARILIDTWQKSFASALEDEPLAEMPFRNRVQGSIATIQLLSQDKATLSLCAIPRGETLSGQDTVVFSGRETRELIVDGSATGTLHRLSDASDTAKLTNSDAVWQAGDAIQSSPTSGRSILHVEQSLLILQVSRAPNCPQAAREFSVRDGRHSRSASGDEWVSRKFMALGVLGALRRNSATNEMAHVALDASLDRDLRWEAVRQLLALDAGSGMRLLGELRTKNHDPLGEPAANLAAQLVANHPQLAQFLKEAA